MQKLTALVSVIALSAAFGIAGCKKKEEAAVTPPVTKVTETTTTTVDPNADKPVVTDTKPAEPAAAAGASSGIPECDAVAAAYDKLATCDKLGPAADSLKQAADAFKQGMASYSSLPADAKAGAAAGCKAALDGMSSYKSMGCEI